MDLTGSRVLITGGAGLVGSHLAAELVDDAAHVRVADDLSKGKRERVPAAAEFVRADVTDADDVASVVTEDLDVVFHLAAYTDTNFDDDRRLFEENTAMTLTIAERMREVSVRNLAFTSSSAVYGEAPRPTPEVHSPLGPISMYGSAKLADEAVLSTFAHSYDFTVWNVRFANVVGPYQRGNVVPDFIEKLLSDSTELEILGDGRQEKSYMHVSDCVDAFRTVVERTDDPMNTYNLGTHSTTSVTEIADVVSEELDVDPAYEYTGGDRGWTGDVPKMRLAIGKLTALGWEPSLTSRESVRLATRELIAELAPERSVREEKRVDR